MSFPDITEPSGPETYSWQVFLDEGQELRAVDGRTVEIVFENGFPAGTITAIEAHDAVGTAVPTSLVVSAGNVITLIVHHRAGNPAAGGAPFDYPVIAGAGWEGGFRTVVVEGPPDEQALARTAPEEAADAEPAVPRVALPKRGCPNVGPANTDVGLYKIVTRHLRCGKARAILRRWYHDPAQKDSGPAGWRCAEVRRGPYEVRSYCHRNGRLIAFSRYLA